mgnify:CR=1 FL=1
MDVPSAGLPVWLFLQSRDFINVHILYVGIAFLIVALAAAAHPDDIEFVLAGTVAKWVKAGTRARYVVVTSGDAGTHRLDVDRETLARLREAEQTAPVAAIKAAEAKANAEKEAKAKALASETVQKFMEGKEPRKVIVIEGKLVNIVV